MAYEFNPSILIFRDGDGDYLVSYDGGKTSGYLTVDGVPEISTWGGLLLEFEHAVWQSGPGS